MNVQPKKILMVCTGNICRSPIAEAVMCNTIQKQHLESDWLVDSAGLEGWHSGSAPDKRVLSVLAKHNIIYQHQARMLTKNDFDEFDYICGMDPCNMASLKRLAPKGSKAKLLLLGDFGLKPDERSIDDPYYYVGEEPFEKIYELCCVACPQFLKQARLNEIL